MLISHHGESKGPCGKKQKLIWSHERRDSEQGMPPWIPPGMFNSFMRGSGIFLLSFFSCLPVSTFQGIPFCLSALSHDTIPFFHSILPSYLYPSVTGV